MPDASARLEALLEQAWSLRLVDPVRMHALAEEALALVRGTEGLAPDLIGRTFVIAGTSLNLRGELDRARELGEEARAHLSQGAWRGRLLNLLGTLDRRQGGAATAIEHYREAIRIHRADDDTEEIAGVLNNLGQAHLERGEYEDALPCFHEAMNLARQAGSRVVEAISVGNLGLVSYHAAAWPEALEHFQRAVSINRELGIRRGVATYLRNIAALHGKLQAFGEAVRLDEECLETWRELGDPHGEAQTLCALGEAWCGLGNLERASECVTRSIEICDRIGDPRIRAGSLCQLASIDLNAGRTELAEARFRESQAEARRVGATLLVASAALGLGQLLVRTGRMGEGFEQLEEALAQAEELGTRDLVVRVKRALADAHRRSDRCRPALQLYVEATELADQIFNEESDRRLRFLRVSQQLDEERERAARAERDALRRSEEQLHAIISNTPNVAIHGYDGDGRVRVWNRAAESLFGVSHTEALGRTAPEVVPDDEFAARLARVREAPHERIGPTERRFRNRRDESCVSYYTVFPVADPAGDHLVICMEVDLTLRNRLEEQIQQKQRLETIGTLAGGIAHDFNNILTGILGYAELGRICGGDADQIAHCFEEIVRSGRRAKQLVEQILTFSRRADRNALVVDLRPVVDEALRLLRASLPTTVEIRDDIRRCGQVEADPTQIHQVVMNLCTNAVASMGDEGGTLSVRLEPVEAGELTAAAGTGIDAVPTVRLVVEDTGCGIEEEILPRVFEPFFTTKRPGKGTGMGLAVVHGIVSSHGGTVQVSSRPGEGSRFEVYLPRHAEQEADEEPADVGGSHGCGERILFVDDDPQAVELGRDVLERCGYKLTVCSGGTEAARLFAAEPDAYQVVVTDQMMPDKTGLALVDEITALRADIPVILVTGYAETLEPRSLETIRAVVTKPYRPRELSGAVDAVLGKCP